MGFSAGIVGVEAEWRGIAVGVGAAGVGARAVLPLSAPKCVSGGPAVTRYLSAGYLLTPWSFGNIDATGAVGAEVGLRVVHGNGRLFADLAVGAAVPHGGSWGGNTLSPLVRLQLGMRRSRR